MTIIPAIKPQNLSIQNVVHRHALVQQILPGSDRSLVSLSVNTVLSPVSVGSTGRLPVTFKCPDNLSASLVGVVPYPVILEEVALSGVSRQRALSYVSMLPVFLSGVCTQFMDGAAGVAYPALPYTKRKCVEKKQNDSSPFGVISAVFDCEPLANLFIGAIVEPRSNCK